jgi:predicted transcriptional regulator
MVFDDIGERSRGAAMPNPTIKDVARRLVERLPENATWDDVEYEIYVRRAIEAGLAESDAGETVPVEEIRREFGLPE